MKFDKANKEHLKGMQQIIVELGVDLSDASNVDKAKELKESMHGKEVDVHVECCRVYGVTVASPSLSASSQSPAKRKGIVSGARRQAWVTLIHGHPGTGKSSLASYAPRALFADLERGTLQLNVDRVQPGNWKEVCLEVDWFFSPECDYQTLVIDTVDRLEMMCAEHVCSVEGWESTQTGKGTEYGKGDKKVNGEMAKLMVMIKNKVVATGKKCVLLSHSKVKACPNPAGEDFERIVIGLHKDLNETVYGLCDHVFYLSFETSVAALDSRDKDSKVVATTTKRRILHTGGAPNVVSKNRCGPGTPQIIPLPVVTKTDKKDTEFNAIFAML